MQTYITTNKLISLSETYFHRFILYDHINFAFSVYTICMAIQLTTNKEVHMLKKRFSSSKCN